MDSMTMNRVVIGVALLLIFLVYFFTKPPSMLWVDSGTMLGAAKIWGIPNPPGFPFYIFFSHFFSYLLPGPFLLRIELISIFSALILLYFTYRSTLLIVEHSFFKSQKHAQGFKKHLSSLFGMISLAFSYQFWSQTQNTEAFIFTYMLLSIMSFLLLTMLVKREGGRVFSTLLLIAVIYGFGAGANPTIAALVPGVLFVMFLKRKFLSIPKVLVLGLIFLFCLSVTYALLPIRAMSWPFINWGNPQKVELFVDHLHGKGLNIYEPESGSINGFTGSPLVFVQSVGYFMLLSLIQFTPFLIPFLLVGIVSLFKRNRILLCYLLIVPVFICLYGAIYYSGNQESWFILAWMYSAIFLGVGFYVVINIQALLKYTRYLFLLCMLPLLVFFLLLDRSGHYYSSDYANNLYSHLEKNAILLGSGDFFNSLSNYMRVDSDRMDVTPMTVNVFYVNRWARDTLRNASTLSVSNRIEEIIQYKSFSEFNDSMNQFIAENIDRHPIYVQHLSLRASALAATNGGQLQLDKRFKYVPNGLTLRIVKAQDKVEPNMKAFDYRFRSSLHNPPIYLERNYKAGYKNILNDYAYGYTALSDWYAERKDDDKTLLYLKKALELSPTNAEILGRLGTYYALKGDDNAAYQFYQKGIQFDNRNIGLHYNLGISYHKLGKSDKAFNEFQIVLQYAPIGDPITLDAQRYLEALYGQKMAQQAILDPNAWQTKVDSEKRVSIKVPPHLVASKEDGILKISNTQGQAEFNMDILSIRLSEGENDLKSIAESSSLIFEGDVIESGRTAIPGYDFSFAQIYGHEGKKETQQVVLVQKDWMWVFKIYPHETIDLGLVNAILNTFRPYDE